MVLHMLAVFGRETAHPPVLIESEEALKKTHAPMLTDEEQAAEDVSGRASRGRYPPTRRDRPGHCFCNVFGQLNRMPSRKTASRVCLVPRIQSRSRHPLPLQAACAKVIDTVFNAAKPASRHKQLLGKGRSENSRRGTGPGCVCIADTPYSALGSVRPANQFYGRLDSGITHARVLPCSRPPELLFPQPNCCVSSHPTCM